MNGRKVIKQETFVLKMLLHPGYESFHVRPELTGPIGLDPGYPLSFGYEVILDVVHAVNLTAFQDLVEEVPELLGGENSIPVNHADEDGQPGERGFSKIPA